MHIEHPIDELLDLVNEKDEIIGQKKRSEIYAEGLSNFRVVNSILKNSKGQLWIPRRTADKKLIPLGLDMSCAGHVEAGETYDQAFARELEEELNLKRAELSIKILGKLTPREHKTKAFGMVYEIAYDQVPNFNQNDFIEYYWLTPEEVLEKIKNGDTAKSDLPIIVKTFYI